MNYLEIFGNKTCRVKNKGIIRFYKLKETIKRADLTTLIGQTFDYGKCIGVEDFNLHTIKAGTVVSILFKEDSVNIHSPYIK